MKAERVYDRGLRGLLGRQHVEAVVEAPDAPTVPEPAYGLSERLGIAALLGDADTADAAPSGLGQVHLYAAVSDANRDAAMADAGEVLKGLGLAAI